MRRPFRCSACFGGIERCGGPPRAVAYGCLLGGGGWFGGRHGRGVPESLAFPGSFALEFALAHGFGRRGLVHAGGGAAGRLCLLQRILDCPLQRATWTHGGGWCFRAPTRGAIPSPHTAQATCACRHASSSWGPRGRHLLAGCDPAPGASPLPAPLPFLAWGTLSAPGTPGGARRGQNSTPDEA